MLTFPGEAHFWTLKEDIYIPESDFGAFRYHEKREGVESLYLESKKAYAAGRGITWCVSNKKSSPVKKESLRDLEEQLSQQRVVRCGWRRHDLLQVLLSSGLLINISVNSGTGDISKISLDKYLLGKLPSECLTDVVFGHSYVLLAFSDSVLGVIHLSRPQQPPEKLSRQEPRMTTCDLGGPSGRRLERRLSLSKDQNMVLVWWKCAQDEVYPWSPVVRDCDRANVLIYSIAAGRLELLCFYKTEADPINVAFSALQPNIVHLVEQKVSRKGEVSVECSRFEVAGPRLARASSVGALQLQTQACCVARSPDEIRLALGCIDGSVLLYSSTATLLAKANFIPFLVAWHPDSTMVVAANEKGQLQCWDLALAPVRVQLLSEQAATASVLDLTTYFRYQPTLCSMSWNKKATVEELSEPYAPSDGYLLLYFEKGPLSLLRLVCGGGVLGGHGGLSPDSMVSQYLMLDLADCAINLLASLSWDLQGPDSIACMHRIFNHLLAQPLSPVLEEQLEAVLGTFLSPSVPLGLNAERQFGRIIHHLGRKFFHQLVRYRRFDKAFRLAMDLGDRDLFMDIFHHARYLGDDVLAQAARDKAAEVAGESSSGSASSSSSCQCSRSSCSECMSDSPSPSSSETETETDTYGPKPTKVTFSDTVTHIVDISSGDEEEDEEESEIQALIVSDTPRSRPLVPPSRPPHRARPSPHGSAGRSEQLGRSRESDKTHPKYLMSEEEFYHSNKPSTSSQDFTSRSEPRTSRVSKLSTSFSTDHTSSSNSVTSRRPTLSSVPEAEVNEFVTGDIIDPLSLSRNSTLRSSVASIVSTPQVQCSSTPSIKSSPKSSSRNSSQPSVYDTSLNLHIAKKSVTTLTDTTTHASVTRVSESFESYRVPHMKGDTSALHSKIKSVPVSIQSSDIFITSGLISDRTLPSEPPSVEFSGNNSDSGHFMDVTSLNFNDKLDLLKTSPYVPRNGNNPSMNLSGSNGDMSLYSFEVSPPSLRSKSVSLSSVSSSAAAFPLLNLHGNSLKTQPPLTVKPISKQYESPHHSRSKHAPLYLKPFSPQAGQRQIESPLLRLNTKPMKDTPLLRIDHNVNSISQSVDNLDSHDVKYSPQHQRSASTVDLRTPRLSSENRPSLPDKPSFVTNKPSFQPNKPNFIPDKPNFIPDKPNFPPKKTPIVSSSHHITAPAASGGEGGEIDQSRELEHYSLPPSLGDNMLMRKAHSDGTSEDDESLTNIKVVHFGVV